MYIMDDSFLMRYFGLYELFGVKRKRLNLLVLKKDDLIFVMVPKEYVKETGLDKYVGFYLGSSAENGKFHVLMGNFIEYDQIGLWLKANLEGSGTEIMIPLHIITFIMVNPSKKIQKKMGFETPEQMS